MKKGAILAFILTILCLAVHPSPTFAASPKITEFHTSGSYTYFYKSDGSLWRFGMYESVPHRVELPQKAVKFLMDAYDTLVLFEDGTVWKYPSEGSGAPSQLTALNDTVDISGSNYHYLALKEDGTVWAWGINSQGQLGNGQISDSWDNPPQQVPGLIGIKGIAAGDYSLALNSRGEVYTWGGWAHLSRVTSSNPNGFRTSPLRVYGLPEITAIDMYATKAVALDASGHVYTWGQNFLGLNPRTVDGILDAPVQIPGLEEVEAVSIGLTALFMKADGTVYEAGVDYSKPDLSQTQYEQMQRPHPVPSLTGITGMASRGEQRFALDAKGDLYAWGNSSFGRLGDGLMTWKSRLEQPVRILDTGTVIIDGVQQDYPGVIREGVTMVPLRKLAEPLGAALSFVAQTKEVTISYRNQKVTMKPGDATVTVNGNKVLLGGPIRIYNNETHVPLRFISELFGAEVGWNADKAEISVTTAD